MSESALIGWAAVSIETIATKISNGLTLKQGGSINALPVTRIETISNGCIDVAKLGYVERDLVVDREKWRLLKGDILFSHINSDLHLGKTALFSLPNFELLHGMNLLLIRLDSKLISSEFMNFLLNLLRLSGYFRSIAQHAVNQSSINIGKLKQVQIQLPPRAEQTRIAEKLEELFSDLDAGVAELKIAQKKLTQYRQSLLKAAVEGALTAEWRQQNQPKETGAQLLERILIERRARWEAKQLAKFKEQAKVPSSDWRQKYAEPLQPDVDDLPELPEGWIWASCEQLFDFITKGTTPPKELDSGNKTIPFLRVTNLTDRGELDLTDKVFVSKEIHNGFLARSVVYPNDVLMNIVGPPLGQVAIVPSAFAEWNINQAIAIFRSVSGVLPGFLCWYLLSALAQKWLKARSKTTAGQTNLTLEVCRDLPFPLPPTNEQEALVTILDNAMSAMANQIKATELSLKQAAAQRKNILKAAFSGQLVLQDPNDEPASVLLERIRAEREVKAAHTKVHKPSGRKKRASVL